VPTAVVAASLEMPKTVKSSFDKTIAGADNTRADKINSLYDQFVTLNEQEQNLDAKIKALHDNNRDTLSVLNKQIKQIDAARLEELEANVTQIRERYKPLLSHYTALNKQIEAARLIKDKGLTGMLRLQANILKIPVKLARLDIESKQYAWQEAKKATANVMKRIRTDLDAIDPLKVEIKAKQGAIKTIETGVTPVWNTFKQAVKKGDSGTVHDTLTTLVSLSRQINEEKQKVFNLESRIGDIMSAANAQIP
jgi:predicted  nucleic acid-binding Zn-ribbon protein